MGNIHAGKKSNKVYTDPGKYVGYTKGEGVQQPTLYFEHGRLTQEYPEPDNIGWHPIRAYYHKRQNISPEDMKEYLSAYDKGLNSAKEQFLDDFMDDKKAIDYGPDAKLLECSTLKGRYITHHSRGKLIRVEDPDFDAENYPASYAMERFRQEMNKKNKASDGT